MSQSKAAIIDAYDDLTCEVSKCELLTSLLVNQLTNVHDQEHAALSVVAEDLTHHYQRIRPRPTASLRGTRKRRRAMMRDFDLIRKLLVSFEEKQHFEMVQTVDVGTEYSVDQVQYHLRLLCQAGFLDYEAERSSTSDDRIIQVYPFDLTWDGHEFLSKVRNESTWQRIKSLATAKGGAISFAVLNDIATKLALRAIDLVDLP
jgi:Hypothetical protein (DUF2513)